MSSSTAFSDLMLQSLNGDQIRCLNYCVAKLTQDNVKLIRITDLDLQILCAFPPIVSHSGFTFFLSDSVAISVIGCSSFR